MASHEDHHCKEFISWSWFPNELSSSITCLVLFISVVPEIEGYDRHTNKMH